jgi:hypothetical protein
MAITKLEGNRLEGSKLEGACGWCDHGSVCPNSCNHHNHAGTRGLAAAARSGEPAAAAAGAAAAVGLGDDPFSGLPALLLPPLLLGRRVSIRVSIQCVRPIWESRIGRMSPGSSARLSSIGRTTPSSTC